MGEADESFYAAACPNPESLPSFSAEGRYTEEMIVTKAAAPKRYPQILMTMGAAAACIAMAVGFTRYLQDAPPDMTDDSSVPQIVTTTTTDHTTTQNTTGTSASGTSQSSGTVEPIVQTTTTDTTTEITNSTTTGQTTPVQTTTTLPFSECTLGDVDMNGEVDIFDASHIVIFYNWNDIMDQEGHLTAEQQQLSDITGDGVIDTMDAAKIMEYCAYLYLTDDPVDFGAFLADPFYSEMLSVQFWKPVAGYRVILNGQIAIDMINAAV